MGMEDGSDVGCDVSFVVGAADSGAVGSGDGVADGNREGKTVGAVDGRTRQPQRHSFFSTRMYCSDPERHRHVGTTDEQSITCEIVVDITDEAADGVICNVSVDGSAVGIVDGWSVVRTGGTVIGKADVEDVCVKEGTDVGLFGEVGGGRDKGARVWDGDGTDVVFKVGCFVGPVIIGDRDGIRVGAGDGGAVGSDVGVEDGDNEVETVGM